ncbi:MAG TPA: hypothetical protein PLF61_05325, partial [Candidatus Goldiibacteriota bacterium]|nr:hypothetical protein [Candidatus Goldiibacteriota bacterium]
MKRKIFTPVIICLFFTLIFSFLNCKKEEAPTHPQNPPQKPSYNVDVELFLPSIASGKTYEITFDNDKYVSNGYYLSVTGECSDATSVSRTVKVQQGTYYLTGFVDADSSILSKITLGDYIGIYDGIWPTSIPENPNAEVNSNTYFGVTLTTISGINIAGNINFPKELKDKQTVYVVCDTDLNTINGVEGISSVVEPELTITSRYTMVLPMPGMFYLYAFVDNVGNGFPPEPYDFFGYYDEKMPQLTPPATPNVEIADIVAENYYDIDIGLIPTATYTSTIPPPTSTRTLTPTITCTFTQTQTMTPTITPTCGLDNYEEDNSFATAYSSIYYNLDTPGEYSPQTRSISGIGDLDYIKIVIENMSSTPHSFNLTITTSEGTPGGDTELTMYNSSY